MKIKILAADSMGVRSMATWVETKDLKIAIDPSAALGPSRYGLDPHPLELAELDKRKGIIRKYAEKADVITISHYHYDHYDPEETFYKHKLVLVKDWKNKINHSQKSRANYFIPKLENVEIADGKEFKFGKTLLEFSPPFYHGPENSKLGWVVSLLVKEGKTKFLHTSDVQGPLVDETTEWIIEKDPDTIFLCGCLTYFLGWRYPRKLLDIANQNVIRILEETRVKTLIVDHHLVRDKHFREKIKPVYEKAQELGKKVVTGAEFSGEMERFLEAYRKELWKGEYE